MNYKMNSLLIVYAAVASAFPSLLAQEDFIIPFSLLNHGFSNNVNIYDGDSIFQRSAQLAHIARSSAINAKNAVYNQHSAGNYADFGAKTSLANVAVEASKTAQAALTGKQAIFSNLKQQIHSTQNQLKEEIVQFHKSSSAAQTANEAAHKAQAQLHSLRVAITEAEGAAHDSTAAAAKAAEAEANQKEMVFDTKSKLELLVYRLKTVGGHLRDIQIAAIKANKAAKLASTNAVNAAGYGKQIGFGYDYKQ